MSPRWSFFGNFVFLFPPWAVDDVLCATNLSVLALNMKFQLLWDSQDRAEVNYNVQFLLWVQPPPSLPFEIPFLVLGKHFPEVQMKYLVAPCVNQIMSVAHCCSKNSMEHLSPEFRRAGADFGGVKHLMGGTPQCWGTLLKLGNLNCFVAFWMWPD